MNSVKTQTKETPEEKRLRKALRKILTSDELATAKGIARTEIERHVESAHRVRFEAWYREQGAACIEEDEITESLAFDDELEEYDESEVNLLWRAWCAAREVNP